MGKFAVNQEAGGRGSGARPLIIFAEVVLKTGAGGPAEGPAGGWRASDLL